ncbi:hypothetical protein Tco_0579482 [Tanacetum coccineum]
MLKKQSDKHSIGKCHIGTLGHTYHSVGDVLGKVEVFSNGEAVEHVAQTRIRMVLVSSSNGELSRVEKVKDLGANGDMSGSRIRVVWMEVGGQIVRARVVSRVMLGLVMKVVLMVLSGWKVLVRWFWMGELSLEEMSTKSVCGIFFGGFLVEELALETMMIKNGI